MPTARTAADLLREVGLIADGPAIWGRPIRHSAPGVFVVELAAPQPTAGLDLALVGKWLERVPELRLDGVRPASRELSAAARLVLAARSGRPVHRQHAGLRRRSRRRDRQDRAGRRQAGRLRPVAALPAQPGRPAGLVGRHRRARGVRGRAARGVRGRDHRRRPGGGRQERGRCRRQPPAVGGPAVTVGHPQGDGHHEPAAPRGQGARAAARHAHRQVPARPTPTAPGTRPSAPAARRPGAEPAGSRRRPPTPPRARRASRRRSRCSSRPRASNGSRRSSTACSPSAPASSSGSRPHASTATSRRTPSTTPRARSRASSRAGSRRSRPSSRSPRSSRPPSAAPGVEIGSRVKLDEDGEETVVLQVVGSAEANSREGRISSISPVGAALMGRKRRRRGHDRHAGRRDPLPGPRDRLTAASAGIARPPGSARPARPLRRHGSRRAVAPAPCLADTSIGSMGPHRTLS